MGADSLVGAARLIAEDQAATYYLTDHYAPYAACWFETRASTTTPCATCCTWRGLHVAKAGTESVRSTLSDRAAAVGLRGKQQRRTLTSCRISDFRTSSSLSASRQRRR